MLYKAVVLIETVTCVMGMLVGFILLSINSSDDKATVAPAGLVTLFVVAAIVISCETYFKLATGG